MAKHSKLDAKAFEDALKKLEDADLLKIPPAVRKLSVAAKKVKMTEKELGLACRKVRHEVYREVYGED